MRNRIYNSALLVAFAVHVFAGCCWHHAHELCAACLLPAGTVLEGDEARGTVAAEPSHHGEHSDHDDHECSGDCRYVGGGAVSVPPLMATFCGMSSLTADAAESNGGLLAGLGRHAESRTFHGTLSAVARCAELQSWQV